MQKANSSLIIVLVVVAHAYQIANASTKLVKKAPQASKEAQVAFQDNVPKHLPSTWRLSGGTDDCPKELIARQSDFCVGFEILDPNPRSIFREGFCDINKEAITTSESLNKELIQSKITTRFKDSIYTRDQMDQIFENSLLKKEVLTESRLTFQGTHLMLDRKKEKTGWSCLYNKK